MKNYFNSPLKTFTHRGREFFYTSHCGVMYLYTEIEGEMTRIGDICNQGLGHAKDTVKLAWEIDKFFRGQKIMSKFLAIYLQEYKNLAPFEVMIAFNNEASLALASSVGFMPYKKSGDVIGLRLEEVPMQSYSEFLSNTNSDTIKKAKEAIDNSCPELNSLKAVQSYSTQNDSELVRKIKI